jgi:protein SCO1/2
MCIKVCLMQLWHLRGMRKMYALAAIVALLPACSKVAPVNTALVNVPQQAAANQRVYQVRGLVRSVDGGGRSITVEHEDIPGFMPSMTMPFEAKNAAEIASVVAGSAVEFRLVLGETDSWIEGVKIVPVESVRLPGTEKSASKTAQNGPRLNEGDAMPDFKLVDQNETPVTRETLLGKSTILTFIFTRCPLPNFCPAMSRNFSKLQQKISADPALAGKVQLLSISFDPQDNPALMKEYATAFTHDTQSWQFASGSAAETEKLTHAFSVYVRAENGTISHGLCTALVGPDGTIQKIWRGNGWDVNEVIAVASTLQPTRVAVSPK